MSGMSIGDKISQLLKELEEVKLVAVTKTVPTELIREAVKSGVRIIGENRVQEALRKYEELKDLDVQWHLIGHLQTNKVKYAVKIFDVIQSVDSKKLALEIDKRAQMLGKVQPVMIEVNVAGEETKYGVKPDELELFYLSIRELKNIEVVGLMTIAPLVDNPEDVRWVFKRLRGLRDMLNHKYKANLTELSMGMSDDYKVAIEEGATMVRIGRKIFGERYV